MPTSETKPSHQQVIRRAQSLPLKIIVGIVVTGILGSGLFCLFVVLFWHPRGQLNFSRDLVSGERLNNGEVLLPGGAFPYSHNGINDLLFSFQGRYYQSCELFNPSTGQWSLTGALLTPRAGYSSFVLPNGEFLACGGFNSRASFKSCELYNPETATWRLSGSLNEARRFGELLLLPNKSVLLVGGQVSEGGHWITTTHCEVYHSDTGLWSKTGEMTAVKEFGKADILSNGKIIYVEWDSKGTTNTCEIYEPETGLWRETAAPPFPTRGLIVRLADGRSMICGESISKVPPTSKCEIFDPVKEEWSETGQMCVVRFPSCVLLLPDDQILAVGGHVGPTWLTSCELYDPKTSAWRLTGSLHAGHGSGDYTQLQDGSVLVSAGINDIGDPIRTSEHYSLTTGQWSSP